MATTSTSTSGYDGLIVDAIRKTAEENLISKYWLTMPAFAGFVPGTFEKGTDTIVFPVYAELAAATTTISEGHNPTSQALTITSESVSATEKGAVIEITRHADKMSPHNLIQIGVQKAGRQAALSLHTLVQTTVYAGTKIIYANGAAESSVTAGMTGALVRSAVAAMQKADVPTFDDGTYHGLLTTEQCAALKADTATGGWVDTMKYADPSILLRGEVGSYGGVRFFNAGGASYIDDSTAAGGSVDVHYGLIVAPQSFGICGLDQLEATYVAPVPSAADPLGLIAYMGWHLDGWGVKLLTGAGERYRIIQTAETTV